MLEFITDEYVNSTSYVQRKSYPVMFEPGRTWHLSYKIKSPSGSTYNIVLISPNTYTGTGNPPDVGSTWVCGYGKWSTTATKQYFCQTKTRASTGVWLEQATGDEWHKIDYIYVPQKNILYYFFDNEYVNQMALTMTEQLLFVDIFVSPNCAMKECVMLQAEDIGIDDFTTVLLTGGYYSVPCMDYLGNKFTATGTPTISGDEKDPGICFDGSSYLEWAEESRIDLSGQSFTIDFFYGFDPTNYSDKTRNVVLSLIQEESDNNYIMFCAKDEDNNLPYAEVSSDRLLSLANCPSYRDLYLGVSWMHVAFCYDYDNETMMSFMNGHLITKTTGLQMLGESPFIYDIFQLGYGKWGSYFIGKLRNFRISKGICRWKDSYDAEALLPENIGPELSDIISLPQENLYYQENTFRWRGTPPVNPIELKSKYSGYYASQYGTSIPFDGKGYLACQHEITLGGQDFTIDGWFCMNSSSGSFSRVFALWNTTGSNVDSIHIERSSTSNALTLYTINRHSSTFAIAYDRTYHFAIVYEHDKSTCKLYIDGKLTTTISGIISETTYKNCCLGKSNYELGTKYEYPFIGSIDEFRISDGIARYTENFTPPATRSVADQYTKILLHGNDPYYTRGLTLTDNLGNLYYAQEPLKLVESDTYGKFGKALYIPYRQGGLCTTKPGFVFTGQDFTVDFWCYTLTPAAYNYLVPTHFTLRHEDTSENGGLVTRFSIYLRAATTLKSLVTINKAETSNQVTITTINQLHHFAVVHQGGVFKTYVDGVLKLTTTKDLTQGNYYIDIGTNQTDITEKAFLGYNNFAGYFSEFRVSNVARWTENFTPPTEKYTVDASTFCLLHFDTDWNMDECDNVLWQQYKKTPKLVTDITPLPGGNSLFFDKGAQLICKDVTLGGQDFTVESWARFSSASGSHPHFFEFVTAPNNTADGILFQRDGTTNKVRFYHKGTAYGSTTVGYDTWFHWAITYDHVAKVLRGYVNGNIVMTIAYTFPRLTLPVLFGRSSWVADGYLCGYLSDIRITDGVKRYLGSFVPSPIYTWQKSIPEGLATSDYTINLLNLNTKISNPMTKGTLTTNPVKQIMTLKDDTIVKNSMATSGQIKTLADGQIFAYCNDTGEVVKIPRVIKSDYIYTGSNYKPVTLDIDYEKMTLNGTIKEAKNNSYNTTYSLSSTAARWQDNTTEQKSYGWKIYADLKTSVSSISLNPAHNIATYTVSGVPAGNFTVSPTDGTYYTQTVQNTTMTVLRKAPGSQNISVTAPNALQSPTVSVSVSAIDEYTLCFLKLNNNFTDLVSGSTWTFMNCSSDKAPCYSGSIIYNTSQSFDLTKAWEVELDWKYIGHCAPDWNNIFAWGPHYSISRTDANKFSVQLGPSSQMSQYLNVWKHVKAVHEEGASTVELTVDGETRGTSGYPLYGFSPVTNCKGFYIGAGGNQYQLNFRAKNFKIKAYLTDTTTQISGNFPFSTDLTGTGDIKITALKNGSIMDESAVASYTTDTVTLYNGDTPVPTSTNCLRIPLYRYLHRDQKITIGGDNDFTIECWANLSTESQSWGRIWEMAVTSATNSTVLELSQDGTTTDIVLHIFSVIRVRVSGIMNGMHHFAYTYRHDTSENKLFVDGVCRGTFTLAIPEVERDIYLGHSTFSNNESSVLNIREFRISKILRYTGDFKPTTVEYDLTGPTIVANPSMATYAYEDGTYPFIDETKIFKPVYNSTEAGTYSNQYYLRDTLHYCWDDGTIAPKTFSYTVAAGNLPADYDPLTTDLGNITGNYQVNLTTLLKADQTQFVYDSDTQVIMNGPSSFNINNGRSDYWIRVKPTVDLTLTCNCMNSSEAGYDFGLVVLTKYRSKVGRGATSVTDGVVLRRNNNAAYTNYTATLSANTTYYIGLHYAKDASQHAGEDRFKVRAISLRNTETSVMSLSGNLLSYIGTPTFSTDQHKFGATSLLGTNGYLQASGFPLPENWTIEFWEYVPSSEGSVSQEMINIYSSAGNIKGGTSILYNGHNYPTLYYGNGTSVLHTDIVIGNYLRDQWVHRAVVKSGTTFYFFENGTQYGTLTTTATTSNYTHSWLLCIGGRNGFNRNFKGYLDGVRISSVARWTANFTPSAAKYGMDANTLLLYYVS